MDHIKIAPQNYKNVPKNDKNHHKKYKIPLTQNEIKNTLKTQKFTNGFPHKKYKILPKNARDFPQAKFSIFLRSFLYFSGSILFFRAIFIGKTLRHFCIFIGEKSKGIFVFLWVFLYFLGSVLI